MARSSRGTTKEGPVTRNALARCAARHGAWRHRPAATAEPVKIGMITTLSGGGAGLGVDMRDGFMLAIKQSGNHGHRAGRRGRRAEAGTGRSDRRQDDPERQGRPDDRDHLVEPCHGGRAERGRRRTRSICRPMPARRRLPAPTATRTISTSPTRTTISMRRWASTPTRTTRRVHPRAELSGRQGRADRLQALLQGRTGGRDLHPARPDRLCRRDRPDPRPRAPIRCSSSCPAAWASPS